MKLRKILALLVAMVMTLGCVGITAMAEETAVEVATYEDLVAALVNGGNVKLTADITVDTAITVPDGTTIDLNNQTLYVNVENSYYNNATIKNGNIVLGKDDVHVCDGYFLVNAGKTLVLNDVTMTSAEGGIKGYAVFHLKTGANLDLIDSNLNISNNEYSAGYIVYAGESTATIDIQGTTVVGTNTNGIVHATTVIENSTFTITDAVEHGINRSGVTIDDSTVTISGGTGRGITAQHGDLVITGNSIVNISDMGEATIELRNDKSLTVAETAYVSVDAAVNNTASGTITGTVTRVEKVAEVNGVKYATLQEALEAAKDSKEIVVELLADATLDITAWQTLAIGGETTEKITINGNGKTLTFNKKNSDWNNIATNNNATLILNNMTITDSGYNDGPWNRYDLNFACDVELNNVTSTKALAFKAGATLNTVTINESGDNYAIWIQPNGQTVDIDGLTVNSAGRGIKIDNQYVDSAKKVNLSVSNSTFTTAKKAAILVKSPAGADIEAISVDITNVAADSTNLVWVDEDGASAFGTVTVTGANVAVEGGEESFSVAILSGDTVKGYYKDLHDAMVTAKSGETVSLLSDVDLSGAEWEPVSFAGKFNGNGHTIKNLIINKPGVSNTGFITSLNGTFENVTFENPTVTGGECTGVLAGRAGGSAAYAKNINVTGTIKVETTHSGYARAGVIVGGWAYGKYENIVVDGIDKAVSYIKHTGGGDGRYVAGIVGHADDVDAYINCTVKNITISGGWLCGGIAGPGPSDGIASGCSVENIDMGADYSGGMFGWYYGSGTIENSSVKGVTFTDGSTNNGAIGGYSNNDEATVTNVTIENVKNADGAPLLSDVPKGTLPAAYTKEVDGYVRVWGESYELNAKESVKYELYSGTTLMATTQLNNIGNIIDGDIPELTWNFFYPESADAYWTTTWTEGHPNAAAQPTKVILYVDGTNVAEASVQMNGPDNLNPVIWKELGGVRTIELPTATVTELDNSELTFAMTFAADDVTEEQLAYYGDWYADFELTVNKEVTFNANGNADGYLSGQYDGWSENWVNVPFEDVTITADSPLKIMEYAAELMGQPGLKYTYGEVYEFVKEFNCGVFFTEEFLKANPDLEVTLELRMYNPEDETESYVIGETYAFEAPEVEEEEPYIFGKAFYMVDLPVINDRYQVGLYAGIDSLKYKEVGFKIYNQNDMIIGQNSTNTVYTSVKGSNMTVTAEMIESFRIFGATAEFGKAWDNIAVFFRPYAIDLNGKEILGYKYKIADIYTTTTATE